MKKLILTLLLAGYIENCNAQLFSFGSGTGVPTETAIGGLLGALIAPMISKGSDAKMVGALLGASAMNAAGTMRVNQQQQQQQMALQPRYVQQPPQQYANYPTSSGGQVYSNYDPNSVPSGIVQGNGFVKSPYSNFNFDKGSNRLVSGQVIFDPFTGQSFRIP